ncbi:MAG: lytic transglycosylase domain-containing protein [Cellvibrionaceae bacterium]
MIRNSSLVLILALMPSTLMAIPVAYKTVADQYHIPADILYAIALTESGYRFQSIYNPWPWTLNIEGKAYRFTTRKDTLAKLQEAVIRKQSVDIGLMQVNWRWHNTRFDDLSTSLNPIINLQTGAEILRDQYQRDNNWWAAVGRYHAPGKDKKSKVRAQQYRERVRKHWQRIMK